MHNGLVQAQAFKSNYDSDESSDIPVDVDSVKARSMDEDADGEADGEYIPEQSKVKQHYVCEHILQQYFHV